MKKDLGMNAGIYTCYFTNGETKYSQYADFRINEFKELVSIIFE